ncbi:unnamed protein product [Prorocentrum cordatum]|uniref:C3H1-type domain-containing protein n=1 Tax=Prorocentrum cordatum TaxID=2364126 RepID=A0ABN9REX3_9DINO|nr:unnamed protein product [Polarella glacialis]
MSAAALPAQPGPLRPAVGPEGTAPKERTGRPSPPPPGLWLAAHGQHPAGEAAAPAGLGPPPTTAGPAELGEGGARGARALPRGHAAALWARMDDGALLAVPPGLAPPPGAPSHGSSLHAARRCTPCNWFWKPGGCQLGASCSCCHACPAEALRQRKWTKKERVKREAALLRLRELSGFFAAPFPPLSEAVWSCGPEGPWSLTLGCLGDACDDAREESM